MKWLWSRHSRGESPGVAAARERLEKITEDDTPVGEVQQEHEDRLRRNSLGPTMAAALHLRRTRR